MATVKSLKKENTAMKSQIDELIKQLKVLEEKIAKNPSDQPSPPRIPRLPRVWSSLD